MITSRIEAVNPARREKRRICRGERLLEAEQVEQPPEENTPVVFKKPADPPCWPQDWPYDGLKPWQVFDTIASLATGDMPVAIAAAVPIPIATVDAIADHEKAHVRAITPLRGDLRQEALRHMREDIVNRHREAGGKL